MLTDNEISDIYEQPNKTPRELARAIESAVLAKLREQNEPVAKIGWDRNVMGIVWLAEEPLIKGQEYTLWKHPAPIPEG